MSERRPSVTGAKDSGAKAPLYRVYFRGNSSVRRRTLRGLAAAAPFLEQSCGVAGHRMQRRAPAQTASTRASDNLIECEDVSVGPHLLAGLSDQDVPYGGPD